MVSIEVILQRRYPANPHAAEHFGRLLEDYRRSGHAPPNMIAELTTQEEGKYWAHVWEAMLYNHLKSLGCRFVENRIKKSGQIGPDFGITLSGKIVWIEAVVPEPKGIPPEYLEPYSSDPRNAVARNVPHEDKLLRWTAAIKDKKEKIEEYICKGIVSSDDCVVIAVNSCRLHYFDPDGMGISKFPYAVEATLPIGPLAIIFDRQGRREGPAKNIWRASIRKTNGASVRTDNFLDQGYSSISAVMGTHRRDLVLAGSAPHGDVAFGKLDSSLIHNPLAKNRLPQERLGAAREFVCDLQDDKFTLRDLRSSSDEK